MSRLDELLERLNRWRPPEVSVGMNTALGFPRVILGRALQDWSRRELFVYGGHLEEKNAQDPAVPHVEGPTVPFMIRGR